MAREKIRGVAKPGRDNCCFLTFAQNCRNLKGHSLHCALDRCKIPNHKGAHWHKGLKKWAAQTTCNNKSYHLGCFHSEIEAAKGYDRAAKKYHGRLACLNLPPRHPKPSEAR